MSKKARGGGFKAASPKTGSPVTNKRRVFFEEATTDHSELAASLVVAREKIEAALKKAREKPKKARKARPGDPAQGAMFERDEDDPANGVGTGDPG